MPADQKCRRCGQTKPLDEFGVTVTKGKPYRRAQCNACRAEVSRERIVDRDAYNAKQREANQRPDIKARRREYNQRPDVQERRRARRQRADVKAKEAAGRRRYREQNADRLRATQLRYRYDLTPEEFDQMAEAQGWRCAICQCLCTADTFNVDHDHDTSEVRGLLCPGCNKGLGCFKDNTAALLRAADYLLDHDQKTTADAQRGKTRAR